MFPQSSLKDQGFDARVRDSALIRLLSCRTCSVSIERPLLLLYVHSGGFVTGGLETDKSICRAISLGIPMIAINAECLLAPEYEFTTGFEDCFDIVR